VYSSDHMNCTSLREQKGRVARSREQSNAYILYGDTSWTAATSKLKRIILNLNYGKQVVGTGTGLDSYVEGRCFGCVIFNGRIGLPECNYCVCQIQVLQNIRLPPSGIDVKSSTPCG
jgi:hypothetical protein